MARSRISNQIATSITDRVRSVQFGIRRRARNAAGVGSEMQIIPRRFAIAADTIITRFQSAATVLLPESLRQSENFIFPASISTYFCPQSAESREFVPEIYYAIGGLVRRFSAGDCLISKSAVEEIYDRMTERHSASVVDALRGDTRAVIATCAALAAEMASLRPIRAWVLEPNRTSSPRNFFLAPNQYVALVISLSIAVRSRAEAPNGEPSLQADDIVDLVDLAVDARFEELSAALKSREPMKLLTAVFGEMLPFIA